MKSPVALAAWHPNCHLNVKQAHDQVYSNTSTNLLAVVIEVTGQSMSETTQERMIGELDLTDTVYAQSEEDWASPHPQGHQASDGEVTPIFNNFSSMVPRGQ